MKPYQAHQRRPALALAVAFLLLTGCTPSRLAPSITDAAATKSIKTIAFVTPALPGSITLASLAPITVAGSLGGVLGFAYDQSVQKNHANAFSSLLAENNFVPGQVLAADITQRLQAKGYTIMRVQAARPTTDFLTSYPAATPPADAYLDVVLAVVGYFTTTITAAYEPIVEVKFRLVRAGDNQVLAQGSFQYSILRGDIHPDPKYNFGHYGDFQTNPSLAIAGISDGLSQAADTIVDSLN